MNWKVRHKTIHLDQVKVMGILNVTENSFSDGGRFLNPDAALQHAESLVQAGADIIDLGAESTRPDADPISEAQEIERLIPVIRFLRKKTDRLISIDTTKPEVARICLDEGADIINDVSGLNNFGEAMAKVVRDAGAGLVLMHRRGNPKTMQSLTDYENLVEDVLSELNASVEKALAYGVSSEQIVVDPGIGFAKTAEQNLFLLRNLEKFHCFDRPILLGVSRKAFIGQVTGREVDEREFGTASAVAWGLTKGVQMFRVHNVKSIIDVVKMFQAIEGEQHVRT